MGFLMMMTKKKKDMMMAPLQMQAVRAPIPHLLQSLPMQKPNGLFKDPCQKTKDHVFKFFFLVESGCV